MRTPENSHSPVAALILAGGKGTRLRAAVADRPKVLADVAGRPFLSYLLDQLPCAGVSRVVLCTGYMAESVRATFGDSYRGLPLLYSREATPLGTGGALRLAADGLEEDLCVAMNGDSFCELDIAEQIRFHREHDGVASLALTHVEDVSRYGRVAVGDHGRVLAFDEKGGGKAEGWINAGIYVLDRRVLCRDISPDVSVSLERDVFPGWLSAGVYGFQRSGRFIDIGTPASYQRAQTFFRETS